MNKMQKLGGGQVALTILRGLTYVLLGAFLVSTLLVTFVGYVLPNKEIYRSVVQQPEFYEAMSGYVRGDLEDECLFYDLPVEIIDETISREFILDFSQTYMDRLYEAAFVSGEFETPSVDPTVFQQAISARLEETDETVIKDLAAEFAAVTATALGAGMDQTIATSAHGILGSTWFRWLSRAAAILIGITIFLIILSLVLGIRRIRKQVYTTAATCLIGSMVVFVPVWLFRGYDFASKLLLGDSPLRAYVVGILTVFTEEIFQISLWVFLAATVAVLAAIVWRVWPAKAETIVEE